MTEQDIYIKKNMDNNIRKKIIELYQDGKSSIFISKEVGFSKPTVLKVLNEEKLVRKKERCKSLPIKKENDKFVINRICPKCNNLIKVSSNNRTITCRNYFKNKKNVCKKCSLESQKGEGNPFYGKKHTKETKNKISKSREGKYCGDINHMKKDKYRELSKTIMKSNWDNNILTKEKMSEQLKETRRKGKIKSGITSKKEKEIIKILNDMGYSTEQSYRVDSKICDIYIKELNLIIEYFGDYWHCNPKLYTEDFFNKKKNMTAKEIWDYDSKKIDLIKSYGYNLLVVWEKDLQIDNKLINKIIEDYVKFK